MRGWTSLIAVKQGEDRACSTLSFLVRLATNDRSLEPISVRDSDRPFTGVARTRLPCYPIHFFVSLDNRRAEEQPSTTVKRSGHSGGNNGLNFEEIAHKRILSAGLIGVQKYGRFGETHGRP
jgi:hypothetical protein